MELILTAFSCLKAWLGETSECSQYVKAFCPVFRMFSFKFLYVFYFSQITLKKTFVLHCTNLLLFLSCLSLNRLLYFEISQGMTLATVNAKTQLLPQNRYQVVYSGAKYKRA